LFYCADLLSSRIEHAEDLVALLSKQPLTAALWKKIGVTIKRFHDNNIYHHDLNAHNILIDKNDQVFLIDFDRGEVRKNNQASWQQANLARLERSFLKEFNKLPTFHWQHDNWQLLLESYLSH
jgi:3-deoxy-D-manno-octulosonic acid kinase